jgi:hypothetical protein
VDRLTAQAMHNYVTATIEQGTDKGRR